MNATKHLKAVYDIRRDNLRAYLRDNGGATSVSKQLGHTNASTLSQITGANATRLLGEKAAREYDQKLSLPVGWFDVQRDSYGNAVAHEAPHKLDQKDPPVDLRKATMLDSDRLSFCLTTTLAASTENSRPLSSAKAMDIATIAYESNHPIGDTLKAIIERLVRLAT
jgi:hypothetical protein